ncbi:hypothetical protein NN3_54350 [Nocardia neocaledoniensis NBRC 108232]|uniref:SH3 domain-containing protein n=1 Tax=Nocardia neocaledoniensis TaxID=236511 RepID=A0A317NSX1_9NOCA|nr:hypothetical protein [Nocardia neocaledoniensis]PWV77973.1 hypothetical protein DFR69_103579 [Nocardia neocaledoniensis]GEM34428.1 hypothetical protein NN3_54350 [Nocardia neocaledoniensis NBRC 108232]
MKVRFFAGALVGVATILTTALLAPQATAQPSAPCNANTVGNTKYEGSTKWLCYSYGQGKYGWIVVS